MPSSIGLKAAVCSMVVASAPLGVARADDVTPPPSAPPAAPAPTETAIDVPPETPPPPHPAPYSLPWQLRSAAAATVVRADSSFAAYENTASKKGFTVAPTLLASYRVPGTGEEKWSGLAPVLRLAAANDAPPTGTGGFAIVNPLVGANYVVPVGGGVRAAFFLGATIPIGMGGGDTPDKGAAEARAVAIYARSAMDNSLYAVNDFALIPGVDLAWVYKGVTLQAEATLFQLWRVRGAAVQHEATKTNLTTGLHVGYFFVPQFSLGADLHYQRWLNAPIAVDHDATDTLVDNLTVMIGPRFHVPLGGGAFARPGIAYGFGLDKPMAPAVANYHIVQLDLPFVF